MQQKRIYYPYTNKNSFEKITKSSTSCKKMDKSHDKVIHWKKMNTADS